MRRCIAVLTGTLAMALFLAATQTAFAEHAFKMCASGSITLGSFEDHVAELRKSDRYPADDVDDLEKKARQGGLEFFSSQVVIKEQQSGSGTFDLNKFQGFSDPNAHYSRVKKAWSCAAADYPIAYFVGFKVREIRDGAILVSREKGTMDVISLRKLDPELSTHMQVKVFHSDAVLCKDIGAGCIDSIFYGRW
jgi:hypothetical protein